MVTLIQGALLGLLALCTYLVVGVFRGPWWLAGLLGVALLAVLWFGYLVWQARHPDWWAPWDEGLPQVSRMVNVFVPVLMIFGLVLFVLPGLLKERERNLKRRQKGGALITAPAALARTEGVGRVASDGGLRLGRLYR